MKETIGIDSPYTQGSMIIFPVFQSRTTVFSGGGMGEKKPLGLLIHTGTDLSIVSFTGSYSWWTDLTHKYPDLQTLHPVFPENKN